MGGAILVLHKLCAESYASGQAPEEEAPDSWGRQGGTMRALQDRLQKRRDLADGCKGLSSGSPLPMDFYSSSIHNYTILCILQILLI